MQREKQAAYPRGRWPCVALFSMKASSGCSPTFDGVERFATPPRCQQLGHVERTDPTLGASPEHPVQRDPHSQRVAPGGVGGAAYWILQVAQVGSQSTSTLPGGGLGTHAVFSVVATDAEYGTARYLEFAARKVSMRLPGSAHRAQNHHAL